MCAATADPHTLLATRRSIAARPDGASRLSRPAPPRACSAFRFASPAWRWDAPAVCPPVSAIITINVYSSHYRPNTNPLKSQTLILSTSAALTDLYRPTHPAQYDDRTAKDWHSCRGQQIVSATREGVLCEAPLPRLESCRWRHTIEPSSYAGRHGALAPHQQW